MVSFRYEARGTNGSAVKGTVEAFDRQSALEKLSGQGLFPSRLESHLAGEEEQTAQVVTAGEDVPATRPRPSWLSGRIRRKEITVFTRELSTLLTAGIPMLPALEGLAEQEEGEALRAVIAELAADVRRGESLSKAMEGHPRLFSKLYTSMVEVGEEAGALDKVLVDLSELLEQEDEIRGEVLGAIAYPCFVLIMGVLTAIVLLGFVLPRLFDMLQDMISVLPLPTRILLAMSSFFQEYWLWLIIGTVVAGVGLRIYLRSPSGSLLWDSFKLRLPILGPVFRTAALGRFARTLGTLTRSGVSLLPALAIVRYTVGNRLVSTAIEQAAEETRAGESLATPLRKLGLFPATMVQMIAVGEESGQLGSMLLRVASIQERQLRGRSRTLISLLAPLLIVIVGGLVGFIVISLLLPIFQMSNAIR